MAKVGAQRAAELTGKSKSTIQRAMNSGKISYELDTNGRRVIDVSELERAFGLKQTEASATSATVEKELEKASSMLEMERLRMQIKMLENQLDDAREQIDDLKGQRDKWQKQADQVLITSQYSQKQAEELRAEIKEREMRAKKAREQRQKATEQNQLGKKMKQLKPHNENTTNESFGFKGLWKKVKGAK